jgi:hypothetical protein
MSPSRQGFSGSASVTPIGAFVTSDEPTSIEAAAETVFYYGFVAFDGGWYILKRDTIAGTNRYATGSSGYASAFDNKVSQEYDRFDLTAIQ